MSQNTSSAVMQQRAEPHDSLDDFPTPPWAGRALMEHVLKAWQYGTFDVWEPAVNRGFLRRGLADYFNFVYASDIHDYGIGAQTADYLFEPVPHSVDFVITNPPFRLAHAFIEKALRETTIGCAFLVRTSFLEGINRYESLWSRNPPTFVAQFAERVPMVKGRCDREASTATSYCWVGWMHDMDRSPMMWIPPCRGKLERPGDYDLPPGVI